MDLRQEFRDLQTPILGTPLRGPGIALGGVYMLEREPWYRQADIEVKNDMRTAQQTAADIVVLARQQAGW